MNDLSIALSGLPLGIWAYLLGFHGAFWRERASTAPVAEPKAWPEVVAIVPARDEAEFIGKTIEGLLGQRYPGAFRIILADDNSADATAEEARKAAVAGGADRLTIVRAGKLPKGWTGKLWALEKGIERARKDTPGARYLWLTDADIHHGPGVLAPLVARAENGGLSLASLMARLPTDSPAEHALVPAYVYFFQMLYPFAWVNDPARATAGAAGGCMLVNAGALKGAGGIGAIRDRLIDDCALGRLLKKQGPIWLGHGADSISLRGYPGWADMWRLIARSAFTQLHHSLLLLLACLIGMSATFLAPPLLVLSMDPAVRSFGLIAWAAMALSFLPTLRVFGASVFWAPLLPLIALFYMGATIDSARRHWLGRGGEWKGRWQARGAA